MWKDIFLFKSINQWNFWFFELVKRWTKFLFKANIDFGYSLTLPNHLDTVFWSSKIIKRFVHEFVERHPTPEERPVQRSHSPDDQTFLLKLSSNQGIARALELCISLNVYWILRRYSDIFKLVKSKTLIRTSYKIY